MRATGRSGVQRCHEDRIFPVADAGVDELFVQQIGPQQDDFFEVYARDVIPHFEAVGRRAAGAATS